MLFILLSCRTVVTVVPALIVKDLPEAEPSNALYWSFSGNFNGLGGRVSQT